MGFFASDHRIEDVPADRAAVRERRVATEVGSLPAVGIDDAVMERTERAFVVPVSCGWDDVGAKPAAAAVRKDPEPAESAVGPTAIER